MITRMDKEVGRVVDQLKSMNALDNTVIIFLSDNGASWEQTIRADGHDYAAPLGSAGSPPITMRSLGATAPARCRRMPRPGPW